LRSFSSSTTKPSGCCLQNSSTSGVTRMPIGTFRPCGAGRPAFTVSPPRPCHHLKAWQSAARSRVNPQPAD
jgi:hypothetical protein